MKIFSVITFLIVLFSMMYGFIAGVNLPEMLKSYIVENPTVYYTNSLSVGLFIGMAICSALLAGLAISCTPSRD